MTPSPKSRRGAKEQDPKLILSVVQEMYASAMQGTSEIWNKVYQQCSLLLEGEAGGFISTDKVAQAADIASLIGFDQDKAVQAYQEYGVDSDMLFTSTLTMDAGTTFLSTKLIGLRALQRSPFYGILAAPERLCFVLGGILENDVRRHSAMYFWRRDDQADFGDASEEALTTIIPHVRQALEVQRRIRGPQIDSTPVGAVTLATFERSRHGILVLDEKGRVLFANPEAERIARSENGVTIRNGMLCLDDSQIAADVERMMSRALGIARDAEFAQMRPIRIPRKSAGQPYEFLIIPVTDGVQRAILPPAAAFMVTLTEPEAVSGLSHQRLRDYGLTGAEARLCQALLSTGSLPDAADRLNISRSTARSHLKSIFGKLGVTSQVQLVMRLAAAYPQPGNPW